MNNFVKISKNTDGSYNVAQSYVGFYPSHIPEDELSEWVYVPQDISALTNFPYGDIEYETIDGVQTLTKWTAGEIPDFPEPDPEDVPPTEAELLDYICELEEENCLYKLGLTEDDLT